MCIHKPSIPFIQTKRYTFIDGSNFITEVRPLPDGHSEASAPSCELSQLPSTITPRRAAPRRPGSNAQPGRRGAATAGDSKPRHLMMHLPRAEHETWPCRGAWTITAVFPHQFEYPPFIARSSRTCCRIAGRNAVPRPSLPSPPLPSALRPGRVGLCHATYS